MDLHAIRRLLQNCCPAAVSTKMTQRQVTSWGVMGGSQRIGTEHSRVRRNNSGRVLFAPLGVETGRQSEAHIKRVPNGSS